MIHGRPSDFGGSHAQGTVVINDRSWALIEPLLPGTIRDRGVTAKDNRLFLEAVLWKVRVGGPLSAALRLPAGQCLARSSLRIRLMEQPVSPLPAMGTKWSVSKDIQSDRWRPGF